MKTKMKTLAGLTALCLLCGTVGAPASAAAGGTVLRYGSDGKFRILCFADTHQTQHDQPEMLAFINESIDYAKPDLVVFLGDNACGDACETPETELAAITKILAPVTARGLPFAFVWGNHDTEYHPDGKADARPELMELYRRFPGCLAWADDPVTPGATNFNLPIYGSEDSAKIISNLWFFDAGQDIPRSQLDWYRAASERLQAENGGKPAPSLAFQHIIVPEIFEVFPKIPFEVPPVSITAQGANRLRVPDFTELTGLVMEGSGFSPTNDCGQFDLWLRRGEIFAAVFGHDHNNYFTAKVRGVDLLQLSCATWDGSYGADVARGATLITLDENRPRDYDKQLITYYRLAAKPGSNIGCPFWPSGTRSGMRELYYWPVAGLEMAVQTALAPARWIRQWVD